MKKKPKIQRFDNKIEYFMMLVLEEQSQLNLEAWWIYKNCKKNSHNLLFDSFFTQNVKWTIELFMTCKSQEQSQHNLEIWYIYKNCKKKKKKKIFILLLIQFFTIQILQK